MKKQAIFFAIGFLAMSLCVTAQLKVNNSGYVGINNTNPSYQLDLTSVVRINDGSGNTMIFSGEGISPSSYDLTLGVRYMELIPVLIKAFQEQQAELEAPKEMGA